MQETTVDGVLNAFKKSLICIYIGVAAVGIYLAIYNLSEYSKGSSELTAVLLVAAEFALCIAILVVGFVILKNIIDLKDVIPAYNHYYIDYYSFYDYEFVLAARTQLIMPLISFFSLFVIYLSLTVYKLAKLLSKPSATAPVSQVPETADANTSV